MIRFGPQPSSGQPLEHHGHALPATDAHRLEAKPEVALLQRVDQSRGDAGTGHAEGVPDRDRAAVDVQLLLVDAGRRADGITWAANASLISTRSMSSTVRPARASARYDASTGPSP
jgi:hypothetical protein